MGLDFVEVILAVEDAFGFAIPDEDASSFETVGRLYEWVLAHRLCEKRDACLCSMTFYKVRRAMMSVLHVARNDVRPSTELALLIPKHRRRVWRALQAASGLRLPELRRPIGVVRAAACLTVALGIATPIVLHIQLGRGATALAIVAAIVYGYLFVWLTKPLAFAIQPEYATVGLFVRAVMARNYWAISKDAEQHADDVETWEVLRQIIGEQLGIRADQITKETRFRDLNVD
jgi:acyl carrier protein